MLLMLVMVVMVVVIVVNKDNQELAFIESFLYARHCTKYLPIADFILLTSFRYY